jgi:hypothetical protein
LIDEGRTDEAGNTCMCQKRIKHFSYMYNSKTKKTILVGMRCCKKFNINDAGIKNRLLRKVLQSSVKSGHYVIIDDVLEYSESITKKLIDLIKTRFDECKYRPADRRDLLNDIENLINEYDMTSLKGISEEIKQECKRLDQAAEISTMIQEELLEHRNKIIERSRPTEQPTEERRRRTVRRHYTCYSYGGAPIESRGRLRQI